MKLTAEKIAGMIDHTNLKAYAMREDFRKLCAEAVRYGFKSVAVNSYPAAMCVEMLKGSGVLTGAAVGFPLGQTSMEMKAAEAGEAIRKGCREFDYVLNIGKLKEQDHAYIEKEMRIMTRLARETGVCCKVIFETCYLTEEEIIAASRIASAVRPDFVKTSTGFGTDGAKEEHVKLMKKYAGGSVQVKAAGGIRDAAAAIRMIEAGAARLAPAAA